MTHLPPVSARCMKVIQVSAVRGDGTDRSPTRIAHFYYTEDGELLACYDPINGPPDSFDEAAS